MGDISNTTGLTLEELRECRKIVGRSQLRPRALQELRESANCGPINQTATKAVLQAATVALQISLGQQVALLPPVHHRKGAQMSDLMVIARLRRLAVPVVKFTGGHNSLSIRTSKGSEEQEQEHEKEESKDEVPPLTQATPVSKPSKEKRKRAASPAEHASEDEAASALPSDVDRDESEEQQQPRKERKGAASAAAAKRARITRATAAATASEAEDE